MTAGRIGVVSAALVMVVACGGSRPSTGTQATPAAQATPSAAQAGQPMANAAQTTGQPQTATPVDFEDLIALLPEPAGWTRSQPIGKQVSMGVSMSVAGAEYESGESSVRLEITDSSFNPVVLAPMSMMLMPAYSERTTDGYKKAAGLNGSPGFEEWENEPREGRVIVVVGKRFVVSARGRNVDNVESVRSFVQAVDLSKLATLK